MLQPDALVGVIPEIWMEEAKCQKADPERYVSTSLPVHPVHRRLEAIKRCAGCPVRARCADFAVRTRASHLIYAGIPLGPKGKNAQKYAELNRLANQLKGTK